MINWLKKAAGEAKFITSHCEGAFLLGQAGLLDQKELFGEDQALSIAAALVFGPSNIEAAITTK